MYLYQIQYPIPSTLEFVLLYIVFFGGEGSGGSGSSVDFRSAFGLCSVGREGTPRLVGEGLVVSAWRKG